MKAQVIAAAIALVAASSAQAQSRGELLYSTHCMGCHTAKMHWRDGRAATDWAGVVAQVRKWQSANSLSWNEQDVLAVARYLNDSFYHFAPSAPSPAASTSTARSQALQLPLKRGADLKLTRWGHASSSDSTAAQSMSSGHQRG